MIFFRTPLLLAVLFVIASRFSTLELGAEPTSAGGNSEVETSFLHRSWQYEDGLPHNNVYSVLQTRDGYIWVGTANGLARFDGVNFTVFDPENTPALKSGQIRVLRETRDGSLWIGTDDGLTRLRDGEFHHYSIADGLAGPLVRELHEMEDGALWVGTITGICTYREGRFRTPDVPEWNLVIRAIGQDRQGVIWVAGERNLFRLQGEELTSFGREDASVMAPVNMFRSLGMDRHGSVWAGTMHGLLRIQEGEFTLYDRSRGLADHVVNAIFEDSRDNLWVGTFGGLNRFTGPDLVRETDAFGHSYDVVFDITEDNEGNIWIGSKDGLSQLRPRVFDTFTVQKGLSHNNVMSLVEDRPGELWVGTWGGGLDRLTNGKVDFKLTREYSLSQGRSFMHSDFVLSVHRTRNRGLWFGLDFDGGIYRYQDEMLTRYGVESGLAPSAVRVIYEDQAENLWVGTGPALHLLKDGRFVQFTTEDGLPDNLVRVICEDQEGRLWFGTQKGLVHYNEGKFVTYTVADGLSSDLIMALYPDAEGNLWIGTGGGGLVRYREGIFTSYTTRHGLSRNDVVEIVEDDFGYLWMSSPVGIFRVQKKDLDAFDQGELAQISCTAYGRNDGILSIQANGVGRPAGVKSRDGRIWFATTKGAVVADPRILATKERKPPPVKIERIILGDKTIVSSEESPVLPRAGQKEIHFSALSFTVPLENRFRYKLEGFDERWVEAGSRRVAYYSNLPAGPYTFRVIGSNHEGLWNDEGAEFSFSVAPYFRETIWFYLGCVLIGGTSILGAYKMRLRHLHYREAKLKSLVDERTRNLQAEIAERKKFQLQVEKVHRLLLEASHKAGMAEVASGVLHNVGNVLNSVNVSATLIAGSVRKARVENLKKAVALLEENAGNLADFLTRDERGKKLPAYLSALADYLVEEQAEVLGEIDGLCKNVDHIKDIVAMQQNYAKVSGLVETLPIIDLVEDALRMNTAALTRHRVEVVRDFRAAPVISVDKHRLLQILVNLIRNAKYSCDESGRPDKTVIVSVAETSSKKIQLTVDDNGVGIPPENMTLIFSHGFTTRKEGHGVGLHSAALAASEIGGTLVARSDGPGCGATFILEIPTEPETKATE